MMGESIRQLWGKLPEVVVVLAVVVDVTLKELVDALVDSDVVTSVVDSVLDVDVPGDDVVVTVVEVVSPDVVA